MFACISYFVTHANTIAVVPLFALLLALLHGFTFLLLLAFLFALLGSARIFTFLLSASAYLPIGH